VLANQEVLHIIAERCILAASEGGAQRWHGLAGRRAMPRLFGPRLLAAVALLSVALKAHGAQLRTPGTPLIIADGGSSCALPVNTLEAYQTAIDDGADFVTVTVAGTRDGEFIVRPSLTLGSNTNIGSLRQFNDVRRTVQLGAGRKAWGYFVSDMLLSEVQQLWATQSFPERDQSLDNKYRVPTLKQVLELVHSSNAAGKNVGVFVQILDPAYHNAANLASYTQVLAALLSSGFQDKSDFAKRVRIQSYDLKVLGSVAEQMDTLGLDPRPSLVWMIHCSKTKVSNEQLQAWSKIGGAIAPEKELLESLTFAEECGKLISPPCWKTGRFCTGKLSAPLTSSKTAKPSDLLNRAHAAGLDVYPFTFRNEGRFMAVDFTSDMQQELNYFAGPRGMGVDGIYTDCTRTTNEWLALMAASAGVSASSKVVSTASSAATAVSESATDAAASVAAAASKAASSVKAATVKTWAFGLVAGAALLVLLTIATFAAVSHRRRTQQYKAWKEAGLSQALDADLPVSTGAVWGLEKSTWSSQASDQDESEPGGGGMTSGGGPGQGSRASSIASKDTPRRGGGPGGSGGGMLGGGGRSGGGLKTYSGMLDSYAQQSRHTR